MTTEEEKILEGHGVKPTSNRILVLRALLGSERPLCLADLEYELQTLEKSSVQRVLTLLLEKGVIHTMEDGRGITRYEMCHGNHRHSMYEVEEDVKAEDADDMHAHFYCEKCKRVFCFPDIPAPLALLPAGFETRSVNYMLKGLCPECRD